jgi:mRNA interferase MazF
MITSAANRSWPHDCPIEDHAAVGLPIPSVVRPAKIATIEARDAEVVGRASDHLYAQVMHEISNLLTP